MVTRPVARTWTVAKGNRQRAAAKCPDHGRETTRFRLAKSDGWVFSCPIGPHNFAADKPPGFDAVEARAKAQYLGQQLKVVEAPPRESGDAGRTGQDG